MKTISHIFLEAEMINHEEDPDVAFQVEYMFLTLAERGKKYSIEDNSGNEILYFHGSNGSIRGDYKEFEQGFPIYRTHMMMEDHYLIESQFLADNGSLGWVKLKQNLELSQMQLLAFAPKTEKLYLITLDDNEKRVGDPEVVANLSWALSKR